MRRFALLAIAASTPLLIGAIGHRDNLDARLLAAHNRERMAADVPPLRWDARLAADADKWARELAATGAFEHAEDTEHGENLWMGTRGHFAPEAMVGLWIEEKVHYRPGPFSAGDAPAVGHYTQLMWRDTRHVGCAVAEGVEDDVLVCRYAQAGNILGERPF